MVTLLEYCGSSAKRFVMRKTVNTPAATWCRRNFSAARVMYVATASRISIKVVIGRPKDRETIKLCFGGGQSSRCSSATTLIMNRFKFGGQKLSKCPDMIRQSGGHARSSVAPLELNQARGVWLLLRQRQAQAHVRPGKIVEGLKEDHAPSHLRAILTEAPTLTHQRRQGLA